MFCSQCGDKLEDSAKFCSTCGKPINQEYINPTPTTLIKRIEQNLTDDAATKIRKFVNTQPAFGFFDNALNNNLLNAKTETLNLFEGSLFSFEKILGVAFLNQRTKQIKNALDELSKIPSYAICTNLQLIFVSSDGSSLFNPKYELGYELPAQIIKRVDFIKKTFNPSYISIELIPNESTTRLIYETNTGFGDNHLNAFYQSISKLVNNYDAINGFMSEENWKEVEEKWGN